MLVKLRKLLAALKTKMDSRNFKIHKKTPAYFKPEHMKGKLEKVGLDLIILSSTKM